MDARLLRPGAHAIVVTAHGAKAEAAIELFSHVRRGTFRLIDWGSRAQGDDLATLGEEGLGFNLICGDYRRCALSARDSACASGAGAI